MDEGQNWLRLVSIGLRIIADGRLRRRDFIALGGAILVSTTTAHTASRGYTIGVLAPGDNPVQRNLLSEFEQRLRTLSQTIAEPLLIEVRYAGADSQRAQAAAGELVSLAPDLLVSTSSTMTEALLRQTSVIPIVATISGDPIALGFTTSLSHPTRNVTGFTTYNDPAAAKRLELLRQAVPAMRRVALLWVPINPQQVLLERQTQQAAKALGMELISLPLKTSGDVGSAVMRAITEGATGLVVAADPLTRTSDPAIIELCVTNKLAAIHTFLFEMRNGALMSYGIDLFDNYRRAAQYVDALLRGTKIADLPFQEPTHLSFGINQQTARSIGLMLPPTLLALADEVVD
jgi:putative tryptophan/tyrosine transport system substrate-binding protein